MSNPFTTVHVGPIVINSRNLECAWTSAPSPQNTRDARIVVAAPISQAEQLSELVANRDRRITIGAETGVLEAVFFDGGIAADFNGWYLLQGVSFDPYGLRTWPTHVPVTLTGTWLGQRQPVVTTSSRARENDFSLTGTPMVADPFYDGGFVSSPGGTRVEREYDPEPHDSARVSAEAVTMNVYVSPTKTVIPSAVP